MPITISLTPNNVDGSGSNLFYAIGTRNYPTGGDTLDFTQVELAATKQLVAAADARQHDRDAQLAQTLSALDAQKRSIVTPAQIIRELPKSLPLPRTHCASKWPSVFC